MRRGSLDIIDRKGAEVSIAPIGALTELRMKDANGTIAALLDLEQQLAVIHALSLPMRRARLRVVPMAER